MSVAAGMIVRMSVRMSVPVIVPMLVPVIVPVVMPCRTRTVSSSREMPPSSVSRTRKIFSKAPVDHESRFTAGDATFDSAAIGPDMALAIDSGYFIARRFGTNSPMTKER